ncbi:hypothetical protein AMAG_04908 [Allomyces macrogynus ATCC 38327]|uniref:Phospholipid/glycerol acyltransferase domain-containing protein n=1 Tax=Allomyces macrogynus (strain ATCC 38327) TaxID=578462 RepID=A0A0L0S6Y6_ALLM3|nr:hypothetical protein AMAG_04908 [Allomyces macrogynus ATCC 38327]|eukprot:KNE58089.1 hypothetical protein AMAG_04908 [Allomyces macrogynus ATCC 38327]
MDWLQRQIYPLTYWGASGTIHTNFHVHVEGQENVAPTGALFLACTHSGMVMDPGILIATTPHRRQNHYWAKDSIWKSKLMGFIFDGLGAVPVTRNAKSRSLTPDPGNSLRRDTTALADSPCPSPDREPRTRTTTAASDVSTASTSASTNAKLWEATTKMLESGELVGVFPEGTSYTLPHFIQFKDGLAKSAIEYAKTAQKAGRPSASIVPVGINYLDKDLWRSSVAVIYGPPVSVDGFVGRPVADLTQYIQDRVADATVNAPDWDTWHAAQIARKVLFPAAVFDIVPRYVPVMQALITLFADVGNHPAVGPVKSAALAYHASLKRHGVLDRAVYLIGTHDVAQIGAKALYHAVQLAITSFLALPGGLVYGAIFLMTDMHNKKEPYTECHAQTKGLATLTLVPLIHFGMTLLALIAFGPVGALTTEVGLIAVSIVFHYVVDWCIESAQILHDLAVLAVLVGQDEARALARDRNTLHAALMEAIKTVATPDLDVDALPYGPFRQEQSAPSDLPKGAPTFPEPSHPEWTRPSAEVVRRRLRDLDAWMHAKRGVEGGVPRRPAVRWRAWPVREAV